MNRTCGNCWYWRPYAQLTSDRIGEFINLGDRIGYCDYPAPEAYHSPDLMGEREGRRCRCWHRKVDAIPVDEE